MRANRRRWALDELIDFEVALAAWDGESRAEGVKVEASRDATFRSWLGQTGRSGLGRLCLRAAAWVTLAAGLAGLAGGFGAAWACLDPRREGIHVVLFLCLTLGLPWLLLAAGLLLWGLRPGKGGLAGPWLKSWLVRIGGEKGREAMAGVEASPEATRALGWRLAGIAQHAAGNFHLGAIVGLTAMIFFRRVGFYWETTTRRAMEESLETVVGFLSLPWRGQLPELVPAVAATRRAADWSGGGESWLGFLMMALLVWGYLPRLLLSLMAQVQAWRALRGPAFQSPRHRRLWRVLAGTRRGGEPEGPADGALVLDLGGVAVDREALRPYFLRQLRLNPVAWETLGVLDEGREASARTALAKAPAGVILLAEGWSLAPRQIEEALRRVHEAATGRRVAVVVADFGRDGRPRPPKPGERAAWEAFFDAQRGQEAELSIYEEDRTWAPG
jgi:hypothetical protein